jgi:hypothetical protein
MTNDQQDLRDAVNAYLNPKPAEEEWPLPAQANRAAMSPAAQESAFESWVEWINSRPSTTWQPDEIRAVKFAVKRTLRTL